MDLPADVCDNPHYNAAAVAVLGGITGAKRHRQILMTDFVSVASRGAIAPKEPVAMLRSDALEATRPYVRKVHSDAINMTTTIVEAGDPKYFAPLAEVAPLLRSISEVGAQVVAARASYSFHQKLGLINRTRDNGIEAVAKETGITKGQLVRWEGERAMIEKMVNTGFGKFFKHRPLSEAYTAIFNDAQRVVAAMRDMLCAITSTMVKNWISARYPKFAALSARQKTKHLADFRRHYGYARRKVTGYTQLMPHDADDKVAKYRDLCARIVLTNDIAAILVCDETFLLFEPASMSTLSKIGTKNVKIKAKEKAGCTALLSSYIMFTAPGTTTPAPMSAEANGWFQHLDPFFVFKGGRYVEKRFNEREAATTESGWMTSKVFAAWLERTLRNLREYLLPNQKILVQLDLYAAHRDERVIEVAKRNDALLAYIPAGCTSLVQYHDVVVNQPLKQTVTAKYNEAVMTAALAAHARGDDRDATPIQKLREQLMKWTKDALTEMSEKTSTAETAGEKVSTPILEAVAKLRHIHSSQLQVPTMDVPLSTDDERASAERWLDEMCDVDAARDGAESAADENEEHDVDAE